MMKGSPLVLGLLPLLGVSLVGTFLAAYVISLRHDATLYARSVNGVRAYFVAKANPSQAASFCLRTQENHRSEDRGSSLL